MSYTYLLAGENLDLAEAELEGFLKSQEIEEKPERKGRLAFTETEPSQLRRLALVHEISEVIERSSKPEFSYNPEKSFAVRAKDFTDEINTKELERKIGKMLMTDQNSVDLEEPEEVLNLYVTEEEYVLTKQVIDIDRGLFDKRKNQERPFSSPISLDPVLARVMVNLSEVPPGGKLIDPFCGTGGILIEAGLCGISVYGIDIQEEMVEGTRKNLENYGVIVHDIRERDVNSLETVFENNFDAVVTDLPYGKASVDEDYSTEQFLEKSEEIAEKTVLMSNKSDLNGLKPDFEIYVHKSMTRYIYVF